MKCTFSVRIALLLCFLLEEASSFAICPDGPVSGSLSRRIRNINQVPVPSHVIRTTPHQRWERFMGIIELVEEPEGGEELEQLKTVTGMRMKNMGAVDGVTGKTGGQAYNFWMTATVPGALVKEYRTKIMKDASKNANFPGFRKGQIPPYAQPKMTGFALQEGIITTVEGAVGAYGLMALDGSDGEVEVKEDVQEMVKSYKLGDDVSFTATLKCEFDSTKQRPAEPSQDTADSEVKVEAGEATA